MSGEKKGTYQEPSKLFQGHSGDELALLTNKIIKVTNISCMKSINHVVHIIFLVFMNMPEVDIEKICSPCIFLVDTENKEREISLGI